MVSGQWRRAAPAAFCVLLLAACASPSPAVAPTGAATAPPLACSMGSNCVDSRGTGGLPALRFDTSPDKAIDLLRATVATFPEARIVTSDALHLQAVFTTPAGFRDEVDFRIDTPTRRIDFRSRSTFGLFDFGKNRARMEEFSARFAARAGH